jgi:predicted RNA-binding Zn-ribbon protein involved in translation (DUF1610 family)
MEELSKSLSEARRLTAMEKGTESACPFCGVARVRRSDYIRCNPCGTNWLDTERHLPNYLNKNPAVVRNNARMASLAPKRAETTEAGVE